MNECPDPTFTLPHPPGCGGAVSAREQIPSKLQSSGQDEGFGMGQW